MAKRPALRPDILELLAFCVEKRSLVDLDLHFRYPRPQHVVADRGDSAEEREDVSIFESLLTYQFQTPWTACPYLALSPPR